MKKQKFPGRISWPALKTVLLILAVSILTKPPYASCVLKSVNLEKNEKGAQLEMEFGDVDGNILYDVSIHELNDFYVVNYVIDGCTSNSRIPNLTELPIMHGELEEDSDQASSLVFNLYLETKITPQHRYENNKIITQYNFVGFPLDVAPSVVSSFQATSDANNSATLKFEFDPEIQGKKAFVTQDSRSAIFLFQNTAASSDDFRKPLKANFISQFKLEDGVSFNGVPYSKLVIKSDNEMFFSESQQGNFYRVELYGQGDINAPAATYTESGGGNTNESGVDIENYQRSQRKYAQKSGAKTILLWGLGSVAVIGGTAAGVWYFLQEDPAPLPPTTIPDPNSSLFPQE